MGRHPAGATGPVATATPPAPVGSRPLRRTSAVPAFRPVLVTEVDLAAPLPFLAPRSSADGLPYATARVLVRDRGWPVGRVDVPLGQRGVDPATLARRIDGALSGATHREADHAAARPGTRGGPRDATVVVTAGGDPDPLDGCLAAVLAGTHHRFEVVVVDTDPADPRVRATVERHHRADPRVRYLRDLRPARSWARTTGFDLSRGELVAFLDTASRPEPGWLAALDAAAAAHPDAAVVTGPVLADRLDTPAQLRLDDALGFTAGWRTQVFDLGAHDRPVPGYPYVAGLMGTADNLAVVKPLLPDLWRFDPHLGPGSDAGGGDDLDVFVGALQGGHQVVTTPGAVVWRRLPADLPTARRLIAEQEVGLGALLAKHLVGGDHRTDAGRALAHHVRSDGRSARTGAPVGKVLHLAAGPVAYAESRLRHSWRTA